MHDQATKTTALDAAAIAHQRITDLRAMFQGILDVTDPHTTAHALARAGVNLSEEWANESDVLAEVLEMKVL